MSIQKNKIVYKTNTNFVVSGGDKMAKKDQRASWESDRKPKHKKNDVPPVPAISNQSKHD